MQSRFRPAPKGLEIEIPVGEFPEMVVHVLDSWSYILLAPLYDVHIGHEKHDAKMFRKHCRWIADEPYLLSWDGGDLIENASKLSVGAGVYEQDFSPQNQLVAALEQVAGIRHKLLFKLPGNHEDRASILGLDIGAWLAWMLKVPYSPDYFFCTIRFRGNNFRIAAHHGTGAAQTAGAQRMAARKDVPWAKVFDIYWTGHIHGDLVDVLSQTDFCQAENRMVQRDALVIVSPSYLRYFGTYAAKKRWPMGRRGLESVTLRPDGRIDASVHASGRRV